MLKGECVRELRQFLGLTQVEFGLLFGLHAVTICRWETGSLPVSEWYESIMRFIWKARKPIPDIKDIIRRDGYVWALYAILHAASQASDSGDEQCWTSFVL